MVSEVAAEKHGQSFDLLDADQDGNLHRADFEAISQRLADGAAESHSDVVRQAYLRFWDSLAIHLGIDDSARISREEFIEALESIAKSSPDGFDYFIGQMPLSILILYDHDRDGRLSSQEFLAMQEALGVPVDRARIALLALDRDADGFVGGDELVAACREFVLSDDPHAAGNWLFGGLKPPQVRFY